MRYAFVYTELFEKTAAGLLTDTIMEEVENALCIDPRAGDVMRETDGVRKLRVALLGRGKRGSARVTYLYIEVAGTIYFLLAYAKNMQGNVTAAQTKLLAAWAERLKEE
jgi:hypothetical protein